MKNIAFILDSKIISPDLVSLYKESKKSKYFNISFIALYESKDKIQHSLFRKLQEKIKSIGFLKLIRTISLGLIYYGEFIFFNKHEAELKGSTMNINDLDVPILSLTPIFSKSKLVVRFSEDDINLIKYMKADVLIRGGKHILRGNILSACNYGIIGLHHGDNHLYRGLPSGFWEVYNNEIQTGFIIQKLTETLDNGIVYYKDHIRTKKLAHKNSLYIHHHARIQFINFITNFSKSGELPSIIEEKNIKLPPIKTTPTIREQIIYLFRVHILRLFLK